MITLKKLDDLKSCSEQFLQAVGDSKIFAFNGSMGAGKTTLIKGICQALGVKDDISSPTFAIVNEYASDLVDCPIYHFDFYRIKNEEEAFDMGYEEYFYDNAYCFIEWPEKITNLLPEDITIVNIKVEADGSRTIDIQRQNKN